MGLMDSAVALISGADRMMEVTAQNVANVATPGYRARQSFWAMVSPQAQDELLPGIALANDFSRASIMTTGRDFDFAIEGSGFFTVAKGGEVRFTRSGQFTRDDEGRLVNADGFALQSDGGDVSLKKAGGKVLADGTVLDGGEPVARLRIVDFATKSDLIAVGASSFRAGAEDAREIPDSRIVQGALETSNVSTAHETISMMQAVRQVEAGQRVVQLYDELLGKAITTFGGEQG